LRAVKAGVVYFLLMFAVGWILGPIRELWAVPHLGRVVATVLEAIIMLIAMVVGAQWVIRQFEVPHRLGSTLTMGLIAVGLLFPAEIAGIIWVRRLSVQEYLASFATVPGAISLAMFLVFAAMPIVVGRFIVAPFEQDECGEADPWRTNRWDAGHPYRYRVWVRRQLPWWLINLGVADKGRDCEAVGAWHRRYTSTEEIDGCYHCKVTRRRLPDRDVTSCEGAWTTGTSENDMLEG
jgi:hypothetical protein